MAFATSELTATFFPRTGVLQEQKADPQWQKMCDRHETSVLSLNQSFQPTQK
ncbi:unnamed protein product [Larinioides sclopetarius]|uniref:Uncharacterized protein n=1 Tax=Larinioides sclopetarius TaxID=280406 RepID=A0AAV2BE74_9ARAC